MPINDSWNIRPRANECSKTKQSFQDGELFYAAIFKDNKSETYSRLDFSITAWDELLNKKSYFHFGVQSLKKKSRPKQKKLSQTRAQNQCSEDSLMKMRKKVKMLDTY
jgi:hypothetical protein